MAQRDFEKALELIFKDDKRYALGAYVFVRMALDYTVKKAAAQKAGRGSRHVSAAELLDGIREFGIETFGPMAKVLLDEWNVKTTRDFGEIVFNMIKVGELSKNDDDKIEDFDNGYDFDTAFVKCFKA